MAVSLSPVTTRSKWVQDEDNNCSAEASTLGIKPGQEPGSMSLPGGYYVLAFEWKRLMHEGQLVGWQFKHSHGRFFTIFND